MIRPQFSQNMQPGLYNTRKEMGPPTGPAGPMQGLGTGNPNGANNLPRQRFTSPRAEAEYNRRMGLLGPRPQFNGMQSNAPVDPRQLELQQMDVGTPAGRQGNPGFVDQRFLDILAQFQNSPNMAVPRPDVGSLMGSGRRMSAEDLFSRRPAPPSRDYYPFWNN